MTTLLSSIVRAWRDIHLMVRILFGIIIGVIQDSVETALNSSGDAMFTATADFYDRKKRGESVAF